MTVAELEKRLGSAVYYEERGRIPFDWNFESLEALRKILPDKIKARIAFYDDGFGRAAEVLPLHVGGKIVWGEDPRTRISGWINGNVVLADHENAARLYEEGLL